MADADRLPMANVNRIVTTTLPKDSAVAKEARVAISACATVFVHYITELAVQQCDKRKKVTLTPEDILEAVREAEFTDFEEPLKAALEAFRQSNTQAKKPPAKKQKLNDSVADDADGAGTGGVLYDGDDADDMNSSQIAGNTAVNTMSPSSQPTEDVSAEPETAADETAAA